MPMKHILVVAPPGRLQEGLQVLLATLPDTGVVVVSDAEAAQAQGGVRQPQLVIVAGGDVEQAVSTLVQACPAPHFLALVENARQRVAVERTGADVVLVEGIPAGRLFSIVSDLLAEASDDHMEVTR